MVKDPTEAIRNAAAAFPKVVAGTACNQSSFKTKTGSFLFIGPGAKGVGFKAMFKLDQSMAQAKSLAEKEPDRFEVGKTGWVTVRFTAEKPLAKSIWSKWLKESYSLCTEVKKAAIKKKSNKKTTAKKSQSKSGRTKKKSS
ncbi:MAG: hypothetical protein AAF483_24545 [Planctomycetota bacterium]